MDLTNDLEKLGLTNLEDFDLFATATHVTQQEAAVEYTPKQISEEDVIFEKSYNCVVCARAFKSLTVKSGKARIVSRDKDLRPVFDGIEASKYDVVSCPYCGFTSLTRFFTPLATVQKKLVLEKISSHVKPFDDHKTKWSYEDALSMYKLALVNSVVKMGKMSERAYICLKIGWLLRSYIDDIKTDPDKDESLIEELATQEEDYMKKAYEGFVLAISQENFPMCGMDEHTINYLLAVLAQRFGDIDAAKRLVATILISKNCSSGIKDKALDLKTELLGK